MLSVEADILAFDLDSLRLLRGYREAGTNARVERSRKAEAAARADRDEETATEHGEEPASPEALVVSPDSVDATPPNSGHDKGDPWVDRISNLEFVEADHLSELHGKLIAAGFLNFQIRNRHSGVEYRITNAGKQFLSRAVEEANEFADSQASAAATDAVPASGDTLQLAPPDQTEAA